METLWVYKGLKKIHLQVRDEPKLYYCGHVQRAQLKLYASDSEPLSHALTYVRDQVRSSGSLKEWHSMWGGGFSEPIIARW